MNAKKFGREFSYFLFLILYNYVFVITSPSMVKNGVLKSVYIFSSVNGKDFFRAYFAVFLTIIFIAFIGIYYSGRYEKNEVTSELKKSFRNELRRFGFKGFTLPKGPAVVMIIVTASYSLLVLSNFDLNKNISFSSYLGVFFLLTPMALGEEIIFRYGIFRYLKEKRINGFLVYVIGAAVFAGFHYYKNISGLPVQSVINAFVLGMFLQWIYEKSEWSIYPGWFIHTLNNFAVTTLLTHK